MGLTQDDLIESLDRVTPMGKEPQQKEDAVSLDHPRQIGVRLGQKEECEVHVRSSNEGC